MVLTVAGSSLFWAWGFLCYLSPIMFPSDTTLESSIGIEYGFFASQASAVLFALIVMLVSHWRTMIIKRRVFFSAAFLMSLSVLALMVALKTANIPLVIACGIIDGICVPILGVAWGTRYSLQSRNILPLVVLSFLFAYLLYYLVSPLPPTLAIALVCLMPLVSWALWSSDAHQRHEASSEVFPTAGNDTTPATPGEFLAGTWEARILPWRSLGILLAAAFIGNLVTSVVLGQGYAGVDVLYNGGILVCACIATMALSVLAARKNTLSVVDFYHITLTFTIVGLIGVLVFGVAGVPLGGAFVQGGAMFLQVLIILVITQSTQTLGISPLLSFSVGQGIIAAVVVIANLWGKLIYLLFGSDMFILDILCGLGLLVLFLMLAARTKRNEPADTLEEKPLILLKNEKLAADAQAPNLAEAFNRVDAPGPVEAPNSVGGPNRVDAPNSAKAPNSTDSQEGLSQDLFFEKQAKSIAQTYGFTKREEEIFSYLARGRSLPYIADTLFVTTGTVKTHTMNIYRKLAVNSRQELLDLAEDNNGNK